MNDDSIVNRNHTSTMLGHMIRAGKVMDSSLLDLTRFREDREVGEERCGPAISRGVQKDRRRQAVGAQWEACRPHTLKSSYLWTNIHLGCWFCFSDEFY